MSDGQTFGERLRSGIFNRNRAETTTSPPASQTSGGLASASSFLANRTGGNQQEKQIQSLQQQVEGLSLQVQTLTTSERNLSEKVQQLEVQKTLLENLIDRLGGDDDDAGGNATEQLKAEVLRVQEQNATMNVKISSLTEKLATAESSLANSERMSKAFQMAVENANTELLASEKQCKTLEGEAAQNAENKSLAERLKRELDSTQATVEALMNRVSKMDTDRESMQAELAELRQSVSSPSGNEPAQSPQRTPPPQEQPDSSPKQNAVVSPRLDPTSAADKATIEKLQSEVSKLRDVKAALQAQLADCEKDLSDIKKKKDEEIAQLKQSLEALQNEKDALTSSSQAKEAQLKSAVEELEGKQAKAAETHSKNVDGLFEKLRVLEEKLEQEKQAHQETKDGSQEALEAAKRQIDDLEDSYVESQEALKELEAKVEKEVDRAESEARTRKMLKQECDRLKEENAVYESQLQEIEAENQLKMKQKSNLIKDLQSQLVTLERDCQEAKTEAEKNKKTADNLAAQVLLANRRVKQGGGSSHADPTSATGPIDISEDAIQLIKENNDLIQRVTDMQEKVWMLESAKTSYETELDRMTKELAQKTAIVSTYFAEAAAKNKKSFFGPKPADIDAEMQSRLEDTLAQNMEIAAALREKSQALNRAMAVIHEAEAQGYVNVVEEDEEDIGNTEWEEDDKFS